MKAPFLNHLRGKRLEDRGGTITGIEVISCGRLPCLIVSIYLWKCLWRIEYLDNWIYKSKSWYIRVIVENCNCHIYCAIVIYKAKSSGGLNHYPYENGNETRKTTPFTDTPPAPSLKYNVLLLKISQFDSGNMYFGPMDTLNIYIYDYIYRYI